jgi:hypothetical protein
VPSGFTAGVIIAVCAAVTILALSHHPTLAHREGPAAAIADIVRFASTDRIVHGVMIAVMSALLFALCVFSVRRDLRDQTVLGALVAFALGAGALIGAAIIDGFVIPSIAAGYAAAPPAVLPVAAGLLRLCGAAIQAASEVGIAAIAVAILLWSIGLVRSTGVVRLSGVVGIVAAVLTAAVVVSGGGGLTPHLLVGMAIGQAVWYFTIAALLVRGRV